MLIRFTISNYLSFEVETEFNMLTGAVQQKKDHVYSFGEIGVLKIAAIYGANGAGKSNLIRAIALLKEIVVRRSGIEGFYFDTFSLKPSMETKPTQLGIEFIVGQEMYDYGLAVYNGQIIEEWLYKTTRQEEELIFERTLKNNETTIKVHKTLNQSAEDVLRFKLYEEELLPDSRTLLNMLFLAKRVHPDIKNIYNWFKDTLTIITQKTVASGLTLQYVYSEKFKTFANNLLNSLHTGIKELKVKTIDINNYFGVDDLDKVQEIKRKLFKNNLSFFKIDEPHSNHAAFAIVEDGRVVVKKLITVHQNKEKEGFEFELVKESDGTQRLLDFIPAFFDILSSQKIYIIDEIDQSIHPYLLKNLIAKFVNNDTTKGQLVFTTHDSNLLDLEVFRQDEIWFAEKMNTGATTLYPLSDFKIRYDLDIGKGYLNGRFGAIPFLGNLDDLNWNKYAS